MSTRCVPGALSPRLSAPRSAHETDRADRDSNGASHRCYDRRIADVASRELRTNTRALLDRVGAGETMIITIDGRPIAELRPAGRLPQWLNREEFVHRILSRQADSSLTRDLLDLSPDDTDDLAMR